MHSKTWIFTGTPLSKDDVKLGSLIPDKRYPHMDACDKALDLKPDDYTNNRDEHFSGRLSLESNSFFRLAITRLLSAKLETEKSKTYHIKAEEGCIYELRQPKTVFQNLCKLDEVKKWLEDTYGDNQKPRFVIGYRTLLNAKLVRQDHRSTEGSGTLKVPTGPDPTPCGLTDVELTAGHKSKADGEGELETIGERIYAICYRRVKFNFHNGVRSPYLEAENIWKLYPETRGKGPAEDEFVAVDISEEDETGVGETAVFNTAGGKERFIFLSLDVEDEDEDEDED